MAGQEGGKKGQYSFSDVVQQPGSGQFSVADIVQNPELNTPQPQSDQPGFFRRTLQSIGLPSSKEELEAAQPTTAEKIGGPPVMAGKMVYDYGKNVYNQMAKATATRHQAQKNIAAGQPVLPNVANAVAGEVEGVARGPLAPVGGNIVMNAAEDIGNKNYPGLVGDVLGGLINAFLLHRAGGPSEQTQANKLSFATHENPEIFKPTLNDLHSAATVEPSKMTVGELLNTVNEAKRRMNNEAGLAMQPIADHPYIPVEVAERIKQLRQPWMDVHPDGAVIKQKILDAALPFENKEWTYRQLDNYRTQLQQQLSSYYKKGGVERYQELRTDPQTAVDRAAVDAIQDLVYPQMDAAIGKPTGYFANMKQRQSNLIHLEGALGDRIDQLQRETGIAQGAPRISRENVSVFGHPTAEPGVSVHRVQNILWKSNPMGSANRRVAQAFQGGGIPSTSAVYSLPARYVLFPGNEQEQQQPAQPNLLRQRLQDIAGQ